MTGSVFNSLILQKYFLLSKDRLVMILYSGLFVFLGCLPILFINDETKWLIYILSFIFGIGFSLGLSTASCLCNDVVGSKGKKGAFVYGAFSFSDKMSCGIVLYIFTTTVIDDEYLLKLTTALLPPISMFFALIMVWIMKKIIKKKEKKFAVEDNAKLKTSFIDDPRFTFVTIK